LELSQQQQLMMTMMMMMMMMMIMMLECTASQTDRQTDDIIMPIADHTRPRFSTIDLF